MIFGTGDGESFLMLFCFAQLIHILRMNSYKCAVGVCLSGCHG